MNVKLQITTQDKCCLCNYVLLNESYQTLKTKAYLYKLLANFIISILSEPLSQHLPSRGSPDWPGCCSGSY